MNNYDFVKKNITLIILDYGNFIYLNKYKFNLILKKINKVAPVVGNSIKYI
jgi:hypothetical protein